MLRLSALSFGSILAGVLALSQPSAAENEVRADFISGVFAKEWTETNTFHLDPSGSAITLWIEGEKHQYVKCGSEKGN
jgi:hypothetical protein